MPGKAIDNSTTGCLILIVPTAFLMAFLFVAWPFLLALIFLSAASSIWQRRQWQKWCQQVNPIFNRLILENQGSVTPLDLAMKANISGPSAQRYLEAKAEEFGAQRRDYEGKGTVYYFITVNTLGSIFDDSEPLPRTESTSETATLKPTAKEEPSTESTTLAKSAEEKQLMPSLIQAELAKRLDVHSSTVYKRRTEPDFSEWTRERDPEGIAWKFSSETKEFYPLETEP
jgi:hypothetical protein